MCAYRQYNELKMFLRLRRLARSAVDALEIAFHLPYNCDVRRQQMHVEPSIFGRNEWNEAKVLIESIAFRPIVVVMKYILHLLSHMYGSPPQKPRVPCVPSHFFLFRLYYTKPIIQDIFRSIS